MNRVRRLSTRCRLLQKPSLPQRPGLPGVALGQPAFETRPHLVARGEISPGISAEEYFERRVRLAGKMPRNSAAVLVGNRIVHSAGAVFYDFQQDNDLFYLTGWLEPNSVAVLERGTDDVALHMFVPPRNPATELWEGARSGVRGALDFFNADEAHDNAQLRLRLEPLFRRCAHVYYDARTLASGWAAGLKAVELALASKTGVRPLRPLLAPLRSVKSPAEIAVMARAGHVSSRAINTAMAAPLRSERLLAHYLDYAFVRGGCEKLAYVPVVAGGHNALTIHYTRNDDLLYAGELVFVDAGGKYGGYCADISRAWPTEHRFSAPQRDLYLVVLAVNKACIAQCHAGMQSLQGLHELAVATFRRELAAIGFSALHREVAVLFPHYIGHHLGLDLHDVPSVLRHALLERGNVVTIEPGLYVPRGQGFPKHFEGIGVRIEDNIAVGDGDHDTVNLTAGCAKEVADVEALALGGATTPGIHDEKM